MKKTLIGVLVVAFVFATNALAQAKTVITIGGSDRVYVRYKNRGVSRIARKISG